MSEKDKIGSASPKPFKIHGKMQLEKVKEVLILIYNSIIYQFIQFNCNSKNIFVAVPWLTLLSMYETMFLVDIKL